MNETVMYTPPTAGDAKLVIIENGELHEKYLSKEIIIGRNSSSYLPDIALQSRIASRKHGIISNMAGSYHYNDCGSTNGTYINGQLYRGNSGDLLSGKKLEDNDIIRITNEQDSFHSDSVVILFIEHSQHNEVWEELIPGSNTDEIGIGRSDNQTLSIVDAAVSRNHASFFKSHEKWAVIDHGSTNGVFINNKRIDELTYIFPHDCIRIASSTFVFCENKFWYNHSPALGYHLSDLKKKQTEFPHIPIYEKRKNGGNELQIHIIEKSVWQKFKKFTILQNINMSISKGEMVLILGGSGAGKTTFLNAVMGYEKADGRVVHDNIDIYNEYDKMKYDIGYVPQQDLLRPSDTVYNTLKNAAEMKMPKQISSNEKEKRIETVLDLLGLSRESESLVRKLSGGQRKRLSIAVEFIANPSLFFLDEPDSGLDGIMARSLMCSLRKIADENKIVMIITHAPDRAAELFDKVIVLAKSKEDNCGHLAFFGSPQSAYEFFDTSSMESIVKRINRKDEGGEGLSDYYINRYSDLID